MLLLFLASALIGSGIFFHHRRVLTYIAFAGVLFEAEMLMTTFLHRTIFTTISGPTFYLLVGIIFCTIWISQYKSWKSPYSIPGSGKRDAFVSIGILLVLAGAYPIVSANGFVGEEFVMHGFYNGDVVTFASLVQKSFNTSLLVTANPFSSNGALEYPTLLHGSFANFFSLLGVGKDWLHFLGILTYTTIFLTIPLFFLLFDLAYPEPKNPAEKWFGLVSRSKVYALQLVVILIAIGLSFDSYVYPQSHFFLTGMFLATLALFMKVFSQTGKEQVFTGAVAFTFALLLLAANSVTGTVAIALAGTLCFVRMFDKKRSIPERALFLFFGIILIVIMQLASNGRTTFGSLGFSVSSAAEMLRAGLPALFVLGAALYSLSQKQFLAIATGIVSVLGFVIFFFSDRNIVVENASRFLYHSFLIGFVLLLPLCIQILYWIRRELLLTTRLMSERIAGWGIVASVLAIFLLPIGMSAGSAYIHLVRSEPHRIAPNMKFVLWWIDENVPASAVVITNPNEPFMIPLFTGRAMLRAKDYWLSQDDDIARTLEDAYAGDATAQKEILAHGSFLVLTKADASSWNVSNLKKVTDSGDAAVYEVNAKE